MAESTVKPSSWDTGNFTASEWTQRNMVSDLVRQKWLLIGAGCFIGCLWLLSRRSAPEEKAARRLVRDWRRVDDTDDARDLLTENVPTVLRPALLSGLYELERQAHRWFREVEREIQRL
jgi:hypothetical protein